MICDVGRHCRHVGRCGDSGLGNNSLPIASIFSDKWEIVLSTETGKGDLGDLKKRIQQSSGQGLLEFCSP